MIHYYFKIALRNLSKRKSYNLLNIFGLCIGMTCCLLIFHYVSFERSYDEQIPKNTQIFRLRLDAYLKGELLWKSATVFPAIAPTIKHDYPEVEEVCRLIDAEMVLTNLDNNVKFSEKKGYFADSTFIKMFGLELIQGNSAQALVGPKKLIVSETMSQKYFGTTQSIGKQLISKSRGADIYYEIAGVFKNYPSNSHLTIDYLASFDTYKMLLTQWGDTTNITETLFDNYDFYTYILFKPNTDVNKFESSLPSFCNKYMLQDLPSKTYNELHLIPVKDIHLYSNVNQEAEVNGNGQMVSFLLIIAFFIICIAWINYINLSTARSVERAKEVGIKKVIGAIKSELIKQFLVENVVLNLISLLLSLMLFFIFLKYFDNYTGKVEANSALLSFNYWLIFFTLFIVGTLLSGIYPALVLSSFQPIKVLKGVYKNSTGGIALRRTLVVMQFIISMILISGTVVVYQQVSFMRNKNLGATIDQTLIINGAITDADSIYKTSYEPFKTSLLQLANVNKIAASSVVLGQEIYWTNGAKKFGDKPNSEITTYIFAIDYNFLELYNIKLVAGRNFSPDFPNDRKKCVLINEKAAHQLGYTKASDAINQTIMVSTDTISIIGVINDYHQQGVQKIIEPTLIVFRPAARGYYSIKFNNNNYKENIAQIEKIWKSYFPNDPFDYYFLDENYNNQYKSDLAFGKVFGLFSILAIIIACFGLLGLSAFNTMQKRKEIGIRKILGASIKSIIALLVKEFVWQIIIAIGIAIPIGWFVMKSWLQDFAYHIDINIWVFLLAGIVSLIIPISTILFHAYKNAIINPVKNLRTE
jgi:putative ABC transport system permease protein